MVCETLFQKKKKTLHKKRAGGVAQGVGTEFKPQYYTHTHKINIGMNSHNSKMSPVLLSHTAYGKRDP
jgi:hypothetical protein